MPIEILGHWSGVEIPGWLRAFDCSTMDCHLMDCLAGTPFAHWKEYLVTCNLSSRFKLTARCVDDMVHEAEHVKEEYESILARGRYRTTGGGRCNWRPVALVLGKRHWAVVGDSTTLIFG